MSAARDTPRGPARKRIFIVDDHPIVREGLLRSINREADLIVCGEAENAEQALGALSTLKPNLLLVDISMPGKGGLELIKDVQLLCPEVAVLVLSMHDESLFAERMLRAGARGYIMKQESPGKLIEAIRHVLSGQVYVSERMCARILDAFSGTQAVGDRAPLERLTDREFEILHLIARGKNSHEIGKELHLSVRTVDSHRDHLKKKLKLKSSLDLTHYAVRWLEAERPSSL